MRGSTPVFMNGMTRTWDGDVDTQWLTNADWVQGHHPGVQDSVVVPGDRPNYPLLTQNTTTRGLYMTCSTATRRPPASMYRGDSSSRGSGTGTATDTVDGETATLAAAIHNELIADIRAASRVAGWLVGILWTSEPASAQHVRDAVLTSIYRAEYLQTHAAPRTLGDLC